MTVFVPKPLRYKCLRILSLFCVICARLLKGLRLFVILLAVICAKVAYRLLFAILALAGKLWLAVPYARLLKGLRLFVGFACCHSAGVLRHCRCAASAARDSPCKTKKRKRYACDFGGGDKGSRTPDLLNAIQALYQLSYAPKWWAIRDSNP